MATTAAVLGSTSPPRHLWVVQAVVARDPKAGLDAVLGSTSPPRHLGVVQAVVARDPKAGLGAVLGSTSPPRHLGSDAMLGKVSDHAGRALGRGGDCRQRDS